MVNTVYKDIVGKTVALALKEEDGTTIDLTSATVTANMYAVGSNVFKSSHSCVVTSSTGGTAQYTTNATDFNTAGVYYTLIVADYTGGNKKTVVGPTFEVVANEENVVTVEELLQFIDIKPENAKSDLSIKQYLEEAETFVDLAVPATAATTDTRFIKLKKLLIKLKAAILYFANSDENFVDPNKRNPKIQLWTDMYNRAVEDMGNMLSSTSTGDSNIRRVKSTEYTDSNSYLYDADA